MEFSQAEIEEFKLEALDLLEAAEDNLLQLDRGATLATHYDAIFRCFHSIKGGAGML
ncbi:Hpt domain-containing protein, partial [Enterococcus faecium]|uniref:Hpt domain-containing protein n=1 Tax=Enterococcus faecium TaxID=1352 RepID=UPI0034E93C0A